MTAVVHQCLGDVRSEAAHVRPLADPVYVERQRLAAERTVALEVGRAEGRLAVDDSQAVSPRLTDTMVEIEGENMRGVTWVVVEEVKSGDWGVGGQAMTTEAVCSLAADAPV